MCQLFPSCGFMFHFSIIVLLAFISDSIKNLDYKICYKITKGFLQSAHLEWH